MSQLVYSVDLTDHEIEALLEATQSTRDVVASLLPDVRAKYETTPMWSACRKLEVTLYGRASD